LWEQAKPMIEAGYVPDSGPMREMVYRLALNALGVELAAGYLRTMKGAGRAQSVRSGILPRGVVSRGYSDERGTQSVRVKAVGGIPPTAAGAASGIPQPPSLTFDWTLFRPEVRIEAERLALRLAGTIVEDTRRMIREELSAGLQAGEPVAAMAERIRLQAFSPRRAATIAQTESSRAVHAGQGIAAKELGVTEWTWLASSDACEEICRPLDGKTVKIGEPFYIHPKGNPAYRVVYHAPAHPHCVLAETPVWGVSLISAMHAKYQGPVFRFHFDDGSRVAVTPNHMLLTPTGFARASDLMEGDDVLCTSFRKPYGFPDFDSPDINWQPPLAEQVFRSLAESDSVTSGTMPVTPEYLHGDARLCKGEVNVVWTKGILWDRRDTPIHKPPGHLAFVSGSRYAGGGGLGSCYLRAMLKGLLDATYGLVGRERELQALLWSKAGVSFGLGFRKGPNGQSDCLESPDYNRTAYTERIRHAQNTIPGLVATSKLLKIDRDACGHGVSVYDFGTADTMYLLGNGIISSNCYCTNIEEMPE
jgi:hypothetical protein